MLAASCPNRAESLPATQDLHPQRLNQVLAKIADREPDLRLAA
jgi:hypothetical protein